MWGILGFALASGFLAMADSGTSVILWRAVQGLGASMVFATGLPILISVYPAGKRGAVLGLNVAAASRKAVLIQASDTAPIDNSSPMDGRATLTEEAMNGPRKEVKVATTRAAR
jgi:hypothetical protein